MESLLQAKRRPRGKHSRLRKASRQLEEPLCPARPATLTERDVGPAHAGLRLQLLQTVRHDVLLVEKVLESHFEPLRHGCTSFRSAESDQTATAAAERRTNGGARGVKCGRQEGLENRMIRLGNLKAAQELPEYLRGLTPERLRSGNSEELRRALCSHTLPSFDDIANTSGIRSHDFKTLSCV
ncbi:hypothetical protein EYF80_044755 [Liparis tanakae]|uniref:Uncharacterized protein n=1 Tax=Liparis tanakae TaxID=230148 RepID=A0A4Z2FV48_9TELE|nr:hypothetical protein EYF80_044755 [Liparis tanakae]